MVYEVFVDVVGWLHNKRKLLKIKNFELTINEYNKKDGTSVEENRIHIKYITVTECTDQNLTIERADTGEKIKLKIPKETDDAKTIQDQIEKEVKYYKAFITDYYTENSSYNLINGESFFDYFQSIQEFLKEMDSIIKDIKIDENLEQILNTQNQFIEKIKSYILLIKNNYLKLNSANPEEEILIKRSEEIKTLLEELNEVIWTCTFRLTSPEVIEYIENFKKEMKSKSREIEMLIDEIKYNLANYLAIKIDNSEEKQYGDMFNTQEEEVSKLWLENENLKIQIENMEVENEIITKYWDENKQK